MDRWDDIVAGMDALAHQTVPPLETILVVDHNERLLARARDELSDVLVLDNPRTGGASGARNTGIARAKGSIIAFVDDDATPEPDWIEQLLAAYDDPSVMAVGGVATPVWPSRRPDHLPPELDWIVGCTYQGQPTVRTDVRNLWGCNMSVRREAFDLVGTFDEEIGRIGLIPIGGEETELCIRIGQQMPGARVVFEPRAVVHHQVTAARTTWSYLRTRSHAEGVSKAAIGALVGTEDAISVETDYVKRVLTRGFLRELGRGFRGHISGFRGAAGIVICLWLTGFGYLRGRMGHRARVAKVAGATGASAAPVDREGPDARAVLPAGDRRGGAARPEPVRRAGLAGARRARRLPRRRPAAGRRRRRDRARAAERRRQGARAVPDRRPAAGVADPGPLRLPGAVPAGRLGAPGRRARAQLDHQLLPAAVRGPAAAAGLLAARLQPRLPDEAADVRGRPVLRARGCGSASPAPRTGTAPAAAR